MSMEILLPKQGNSVESCIILEWKKKEGDAVKTGEPIVEVETDKATFDVESTADGTLLSRLVAEGDDVPVLAPIAIVGEPGEKVAGKPQGDAPADGSAPTPSSSAQVAAAAGSVSAPESTPATARPAAGAPGASQLRTSVSPRSGRVAISPRARKLADQLGMSYESISGSGPNGRVMVRDVEAAKEAAPAGGHGSDAGARASGAPTSAAGGLQSPVPDTYEEIPVTGIRRIIADRMLASLTTTAQFTMNASADARRMLQYRSNLKSSERSELKSISINDLVMFAVSRVLGDYREMNATFSDGVVRRYSSVNLGFAVDTERGLMVPVIRGANRLTLVELAAEAHRLAEACKTMKARPEDLTGGTFSVTNLGSFGIQSFTPVLDPPQVGILGVGAIEPRPVIADGATTFVQSVGLSLTINHQIVDGAPGARFLQSLAGAIAKIDLTLAQ